MTKRPKSHTKAQVDDGSDKISSDGRKFVDENTKKREIGIAIGDDWESKRIKMKANMPDEVAKIPSSRPKLVMIWRKYLLKRCKSPDENTKISRSRYLRQGYNLEIIQILDRDDHNEAE